MTVPTQPPQQGQQPAPITEEAKTFIKWKVAIMENLETKPLVEQLHTHVATLNKLLRDEHAFKVANRGFIAGATEDCAEVKTKLAHLWQECPPINPTGGKTTVGDKDSWLRTQRTADKELAALIARQAQVLAGIEGFRIDIESAKRKVDATIAVLRLKTAQIEFLGRSI